MRAKWTFTALAACAGLAGCGDTLGEQVLFGAGAGYLGSAVVEGDRTTGAAVGAAANVLYCQEHPDKC